MKTIVLTDMKAVGTANGVRLSCQVHSSNFPAELWYDISGVTVEQLGDMTMNWAVVALLLPAMNEGSNLVVEGPMSSKYHYYLNNDVQSALRIYEPKFQQIRVSASELRAARRPATGRTATGFSAGIDSFATLSLFSGTDQPGPLEITDLCTFNVGAMEGAGDSVGHIAEQYAARTRQFASAHGLTDTFIDSNLVQFYSKALYFEKTHTFRSMSAALCLENLFDYYLYSSAVGMDEIGVRPGTSMAYLDSIMLPMLSTENLTLVSAGAGLNRFEKTALVAKRPEAGKLLDVCVAPVHVRLQQDRPNCSTCWKCNRTMISLEAHGTLEAFADVFYLERYYENKRQAYEMLMTRAIGGNALDIEAMRYGQAAGLPLKPDLRLRARVRGKLLRDTIRARLRRLPVLNSLLAGSKPTKPGAAKPAP